jgi:imidazolonepropionase-like amidohydrolase
MRVVRLQHGSEGVELATVGTLAQGKRADLIAVATNPLEDISALQQVVFVMQAGRVVVDRRPAAQRAAGARSA